MRPRLPLNNLNTFAVAAELLSFQAAAARLHVTPSAVSHQIRNLESLLDYRLFDRVDKGIRLTSAGERLFADVREPLRQLRETAGRAMRAQAGNLLAVSVAPVFATRWLMPRLRDFHRTHPEINLSVIATAEVLGFGSDEIGAAIRIGRGDWTDADVEMLFRPEMAAVCAPRLIQRNGGQFEAAQLRLQTLVDNTAMPGLWEAWFQSAGVPPPRQQATLQVQGTAQVLEAVQSGDSVGLVDLHLVQPDLEAGRIGVACAHQYTQGDSYCLAFPKVASLSEAQLSFRQWLRRRIGEDRPLGDDATDTPDD